MKNKDKVAQIITELEKEVTAVGQGMCLKTVERVLARLRERLGIVK